MSNLDYKPSYRRNLPHLQPSAATLFVTFRLAGSLPRLLLEQWTRQGVDFESELAHIRTPDERKSREREFQRQRFAGLESYLDTAQTGPTWLKEPRIAALVADSMRHRDKKAYQLDAYCIMPNHVHMVFTPLPVAQAASLCHSEPGVPVAQADSLCDATHVAQAATLCYHSLASIMHSLKGHTAREANRLLGRTGAFWEHESYNHYVRNDQELERIVGYVLNNPVKAGLAADWKVWPWSFCRAPL